jgi:hypothetical protein
MNLNLISNYNLIIALSDQNPASTIDPMIMEGTVISFLIWLFLSTSPVGEAYFCYFSFLHYYYYYFLFLLNLVVIVSVKSAL